MNAESPKMWLGLSALTVAIILNLSVIILIAKNKRNWSAVNVFIVAYALNEAIFCFSGAIRWSLNGIFKIPVATPVGCEVFFFVMETTLVLNVFILPTIFVTIAKLKQMRLRIVCAVILVEIVTSAIFALPFVYYYEVNPSNGKSICVKHWNAKDNRREKMRLVHEFACFILAGIVLMMNRKQFKFGKSLGFFLTSFLTWFPDAVSKIAVNLVEYPVYVQRTLTFIFFIGLIVKPISLLMMVEKGNEILSDSRVSSDDVERVELAENRNQ
jgi:hypothetical protein